MPLVSAAGAVASSPPPSHGGSSAAAGAILSPGATISALQRGHRMEASEAVLPWLRIHSSRQPAQKVCLHAKFFTGLPSTKAERQMAQSPELSPSSAWDSAAKASVGMALIKRSVRLRCCCTSREVTRVAPRCGPVRRMHTLTPHLKQQASAQKKITAGGSKERRALCSLQPEVSAPAQLFSQSFLFSIDLKESCLAQAHGRHDAGGRMTVVFSDSVALSPYASEV
mmetsp:Transcript_324/g.919  ORF Transcript_324/g.919 Transcript_324/m.919 type:complete len:226 (-) Transcript_324:251-928(-)